jgi:hypothetical protein
MVRASTHGLRRCDGSPILSDRVIARERYLLFGRCLFDVCLIAPAASGHCLSDRVDP